MATPAELGRLAEQGYFITDNAVEPTLLPELQAAARRVVEKVRSGRVNVHTHYADGDAGEPLAIRGLLAPEFDEPVFSRYLISEPVMTYAHAILGPHLRLGSMLLFVSPRHRDWSHHWHRDFDIGFERSGGDDLDRRAGAGHSGWTEEGSSLVSGACGRCLFSAGTEKSQALSF